VFQPLANLRVIDKGGMHLPFINKHDIIDNGNGNALGLEGPRYVSEC